MSRKTTTPPVCSGQVMLAGIAALNGVIRSIDAIGYSDVLTITSKESLKEATFRLWRDGFRLQRGVLVLDEDGFQTLIFLPVHVYPYRPRGPHRIEVKDLTKDMPGLTLYHSRGYEFPRYTNSHPLILSTISSEAEELMCEFERDLSGVPDLWGPLFE